MNKKKLTEITLQNGTFTVCEISKMIGSSEAGILKNVNRIKQKLNIHCVVSVEGKGKNTIFTLSNVPIEPIPSNKFGKDTNKRRKERSDKGRQRSEYETIKEHFKPLIYSLVLSQVDFSYVGSFNNWMQYSKLTNLAWGKMNIRYNRGQIINKELNDFFRIEGKSLNHMFHSALSSMLKENSITKEEVRIAVINNIDIIQEFGSCEGNISEDSYRILKNKEKEEIDLIEKEVCEKFGISSIYDLAYGNKEKGISRDFIRLKQFKNEFNSIILKKFGYHMCYRGIEVSIKNIEDIDKFKEKYGITEDMQKVVTTCKDCIYKNRLKKATKRYEKIVDDVRGTWFETEENLSEAINERNTKLKIWNENYRLYIHDKKQI